MRSFTSKGSHAIDLDKYKNLPRWKRKKLYKAELKAITTKYKPDDLNLPSIWYGSLFDRLKALWSQIRDRIFEQKRVRSWKDYIKYNADWNSMDLIDIILYKLERMKLYQKYFSWNAEDENIIKEIDTALAMGKKVADTDYFDEITEWEKEHVYTYPIVREHFKCSVEYPELAKYMGKFAECDDDGRPLYDIDDLSPKDQAEYDTLYAEYQKAYKAWEKVFEIEEEKHILFKGKKRLSSEIDYSDLFDEKDARQFIADNNIDRNTVDILHHSEWDEKANEKAYKMRIEEAVKQEQADWDAFFLYISKHFQKWWD